MQTDHRPQRPWPFAFTLPLVMAASVPGQGRVIGFEETFALAADRAKALEQLVPGSREHLFYACLEAQHRGDFERVEELLAAWRQQHGRGDRELERIELRQALLRYERDPEGTHNYLVRRFGLRFDAARVTPGTATDLPSKLDGGAVSAASWLTEVLAAKGRPLEDLEDHALAQVAARELTDAQLMGFLSRVTRPDLPGLVGLVLRDMRRDPNRGFGTYGIHQRLSLAQLEECLSGRPELLADNRFVDAYLVRLAPGADEDPRDLAVHAAHVERLERFVARLAPAFDGLKAQVTHARLVLDLERGALDRGRLLAHLRVARQRSYTDPVFLRDRPEVGLGGTWSTSLPEVRSDEAVVREYLARLFEQGEPMEPFVGTLRRDLLERHFAEAKLLTGAPNPERWAKLLDDNAYYERLKERVELDFPRGQRRSYAPEDPVRIELDVKNVPNLLVKVFEIDTLGYFEAQRKSSSLRDIDATIDLDGLIAHREVSHVHSEAPIRRVRRTFEFPELTKAGVYVIEFVGNGVASRAVIRKGNLSAVERVGAAGHVFQVLDHAGQRVTDAAVRVGGREFSADERGEVLVPFTSEPGTRQIVIRRGDFAVLDEFVHRPEAYQLEAQVHINRESLVSGETAQVVVRPRLSLAGERVPVGLLKDVLLEVAATDLDGVVSSSTVRGFVLKDGAESVHEILVPPRTAAISVTLRGKVESLAERRELELSADTRAFEFNGIERTDEVHGALLTRTASGYILEVRGKNGEPQASQPVAIQVKHRDFRSPRTFSLQTDSGGRIELGPLDGIVGVQVDGVGAEALVWSLEAQLRTGAPNQVHVLAGEAVRVPYEGSGPLAAGDVMLLELRQGAPYADRSSEVRLVGGYLEVRGLAAGDYELALHRTGQSFAVRVAAGARVAGRSFGGVRRLELSRPLDLNVTATRFEGEDLVVDVAGAGPRARVHVFAARYVPTFDPHQQLALGRSTGLEVESVLPPDCSYEAGRRISDEYRYILERRLAKVFPGNMLGRPGLILNPWAVDESTADTLAKSGAEGGQFGGARGGRRSRGPADEMATQNLRQWGVGARTPAFVSVDFLAEPAALALNLVPDAQGRVRVPRALFGERHIVDVVAVDDEVTVSRRITMPESQVATRDRRMALVLDPLRHFIEERRIEFVDAGASVTFADAANAGVETFDSLADVYRYFAAQSGDPELAKFEFMTRWPSLSDEERLALYSEFACHELHVFLRERDPDFFQRVVAPYLANKLEPNFVDQWLLGRDLTAYLEPWAFSALNTFERILLLRSAGGGAARHIRELVELLPPDQFDPELFFDRVLATGALDAAPDTLSAEVAQLKRKSEDAARRELAPSAGGPSSPGPPARPRRSNAPGAPPPSAAAPEPDSGFLGGLELAEAEKALADSDDRNLEDGKLDLGRRAQELRSFYRDLPDTAELAERNYWRVRIAAQDASLITPTPFWRDFAEAGPGAPFVSTHFPMAIRNTNEMLLALALLDLPFEAAAHSTEVRGQGVDFRAGSRLLLARKGLREVAQVDESSPILVGQDFFRLDEPFVFENGRQRDKLVTGEFVKGVGYGCRVVVTNPASTPVDVEVLTQLPAGALPLRGSVSTKGRSVSLNGYGSASLEYAFYFPAAGTFDHYPAHVGEDGELIAFAPAARIVVADAPSTIDTTSWEHVSQMADEEELFRFLEGANLSRLDLSRIAWRMRDRSQFERMVTYLRGRFTFEPALWQYGLQHKDARAIREFLGARGDVAALVGPWLRSPLLDVDSVERRYLEQLEYEPLVNGRVHTFGGERRILNASFAQQYQRFVASLAYKPELTALDRLALTYYLVLQERIEEALAMFAAVDPATIQTKLQYDYMRAYLAFYSATPEDARRIAEPYIDHPVARWRNRFRDVVAQLDEAAGRGPAAVSDPENRDQQQGLAAATEPSLELSVEARRVTLTYANVTEAEVRYRPMDIELLFSTSPFLTSGSGSSAAIRPNRADRVALPAGQDSVAFELPAELSGRNVLVEVRAGGVVRSVAYYANDLRVQGLESYGQVAVRRATDGAPLPAAYVKVYVRLADGTVRFHKDGYTDLRGRFDYVSLSGMDGAVVQRYAVLVLSEQHGAVVREFGPPQR